MSSFSGQIVWIAVLLVALSGNSHAQSRAYPKPQVASAKGELADDFTLTDQDGKKFRLSDQRGHWVLLFFYTGYW